MYTTIFFSFAFFLIKISIYQNVLYKQFLQFRNCEWPDVAKVVVPQLQILKYLQQNTYIEHQCILS